jgi:putative heme iron utilization protein
MSSKNLENEYVKFMQDAKSVYISSIHEYKGGVAPEISYSPCIVDENKNIYILVSTLTKRTESLLAQRNVSLMFIEPEEQCKEIYVRTRLIFVCSTLNIAREMGAGHLLWDELVEQFTAKFGDIISMLVSFKDFKMFRFRPIRGTFVKGFGKAYTIEGKDMDQIEHINFTTGEKM